MTAEVIGRLAVALGIGLLAGLQREFAKKNEDNDDLFAGARTFALLGLAGGVAAHGSELLGSSLVFAAALVLVGTLLTVAYFAGVRDGRMGLTTEMAAVVVFLSGGLAGAGDLEIAAAVGVTTTTLLAIKPQTRMLVSQIDQEDIYATLRFAILALLVLPLLPTRTYGDSPFDATSPFKVGLMVLFISGLSFVGYALLKVVDSRRGIALTGVLGGLVSSTAVTISFSERSKDSDALSRPLAVGLLLAWTIMFARVIIEVAAVNPELLGDVWLPIGLGGLGGLVAAWALAVNRDKNASADEQEEFSNPFRLLPAIQFGLIYGAVLVASKAATDYLGDAGVYASAVVSGIADVDAITLSMAELSIDDGAIADQTAATAIGIAAATNTLVKGMIVLAVGSKRMRRFIVPALFVTVGSTLLGTIVVRAMA